MKPTAADFTVGDILLQYDGKAVTYCLYLGEGKFITMCTGDPNGTAPVHRTAEEVIESCFSEKVEFFALQRVSLLYGAKDIR